MADPVAPDPGLINDDIRPTRESERTWSVGAMASLWVGMVVCVPTYMLAGSMISDGMNWWQAVGTVMLGNLIVLVPMVLNGHPGTKYGIPFPVLARASWGIQGAHIPSVARALVACGWFGIQTWFGGFAIYQLLNVLLSGALEGSDLPVLGINFGEFACFLAFWGLQLVVVYKGVESIRLLEQYAAPFLIAMGLALLGWAYLKADGFGPMLSTSSEFGPDGSKPGGFWAVFFPSLTAMVGFWATLSLNIPDFTRYAKSQKDQMLGQLIGLPTTMTLFAFIGVAVTSATVVIYGEAVPDPTVLLGKMGGGFAVVLSLFALSVATLSTNIAANVVSPANVFINLKPSAINFRRGGLITAGLGVAIFPPRIAALPPAPGLLWSSSSSSSRPGRISPWYPVLSLCQKVAGPPPVTCSAKTSVPSYRTPNWLISTPGWIEARSPVCGSIPVRCIASGVASVPSTLRSSTPKKPWRSPPTAWAKTLRRPSALVITTWSPADSGWVASCCRKATPLLADCVETVLNNESFPAVSTELMSSTQSCVGMYPFATSHVNDVWDGGIGTAPETGVRFAQLPAPDGSHSSAGQAVTRYPARSLTGGVGGSHCTANAGLAADTTVSVAQELLSTPSALTERTSYTASCPPPKLKSRNQGSAASTYLTATSFRYTT